MVTCVTTGTYAYDPNVRVLFADTITTVALPTGPEVTGAADLNEAPYNLTDIIGWEVASDVVRDPPWGAFEVQRVGGRSVDRSELLLAAARDGNDVRTLLARGDAGFVLILPSGPYADHPAAPLNVYPVTVAQVTQRQRLDTGGGSLIHVTFAVTADVGENVTVVSP